MNIFTKAILVKLSISQFNAKRQDAKVTREVLQDKNAKNTAGVWMKNLVDPKTLEGINQTAQAARQRHYELSLPWQDEGWRILPTAMYLKYAEEMRDTRKKFNADVEKFLAKYPQYIEEAKAALNGMFNPSDYPTIGQVKNKFGFNVDFTPLPCGSDFRVVLADGELETIKADVDKRVEEATAQAMTDLWKRLADPVKKMVDTLGEPDKIFRDTLIGNVQEIVKLIPSLNITDDVHLAQIANECKEKLSGYSPETLRVNKEARNEAAKKAEEILKKMEGYV